MIAHIATLVAKLAEALCMALLFAMFAVVLAGVAARYVFAAPIAWSDELGMILLLWSVFIADAFVTRDKGHIAFDLVWDRLGPAGRRVLLLLQTALFAALFAVALPAVLDYVLFLWRERTSALLWRLDVVYFCFVIYLAMLAVRLAAKFVRLLGPHWRTLTADGDVADTANVIG